MNRTANTTMNRYPEGVDADAVNGRTKHPGDRTRRTPSNPWIRTGAIAFALGSTFLAACGSDSQSQSHPTTIPATTAVGATTSPASTSTTGDHDHDHAGTISPADRAAAQLATAGYQDVKTAEAAGYASSLDTLGCFEDSKLGGMGVHYINQSLMDATVDITKPEGLVYELDADGKIAGLVAHEYIVPVDAWTSTTPPSLFGMSFHRHPTLPLWVLHVWLWKDNSTGIFSDWNPAVRQCPSNVPIFGVDLPRPASSSASTTTTG
jgi:hypothetical protein